MGRRATAALLAMSLAAGALLACSGDDDDAASPEERPADGEVTGPPIEDVDGAQLYELRCSACHQSDGTGIDGVYPPLADSAFVAIDDAGPVAETVIHGRAGMPAWGGQLSDTEIAAILSYLRSDLNDAEPVDPEVVREARDRPGLEEEAPDDPSGNVEEQGEGD
jgi:cytochrome c6